MVYDTSRNAPKRLPGRTQALVLKHTLAGMYPRQVASRLGISTQAVYKHLRSLRASGELPEDAA